MDILMPQLGETVAEGTVTSWYKQVGDAIRADEPLFDVETDKVSTEIPSPMAGVLAEILVPAGTTVQVGTRLAVVRTPAELPSPAVVAPHTPAAGRAVPDPGPADDPRSPSVRTPDEPSVTSAATPAATPRLPGHKLSPVVRRLLAQHAIEPSAVRGTGRDGRVTRDDVLAHVEQAGRKAQAQVPVTPATAAPSPASALRPATAPAPSPFPARAAQAPNVALSLPAAETFVAFNTIRRKTAVAMARAWTDVPHVLQAVEVDFSRIETVRTARGATWKAQEGFALNYLPFIAVALCQALSRFGHLNARIEGEGLVVSRRVHLGIAVDLNHEGLLVPVVRDAQDRTLAAIAREIRRLAAAARAGRLRPDDVGNATYTLSNSGAFGTLITAPIVNPPQVAILSTDGVKKRPVVIESPQGDSIAIRPVGVLAQSFDHRAVDGAYSAAFLRDVKHTLETRDWAADVPA